MLRLLVKLAQHRRNFRVKIHAFTQGAKLSAVKFRQHRPDSATPPFPAPQIQYIRKRFDCTNGRLNTRAALQTLLDDIVNTKRNYRVSITQQLFQLPSVTTVNEPIGHLILARIE